MAYGLGSRSVSRKTQSDLVWRKSSKSTNSAQCVEVAFLSGAVHVRDSKDPQGPMLIFTEGEWNAFVKGVDAREFDWDVISGGMA